MVSPPPAAISPRRVRFSGQTTAAEPALFAGLGLCGEAMRVVRGMRGGRSLFPGEAVTLSRRPYAIRGSEDCWEFLTPE